MVRLSTAIGSVEIVGRWRIKGVHETIDLVKEGQAVQSVQSSFGLKPMIGAIDQASEHFILHVQMGGFPLFATLSSPNKNVICLQFSNGGLWTRADTCMEEDASSVSTTDGARGIPMSEVQKHNTKDSAWVVLHGHIYDLTEFLADHPGGAEVILKWAGRDATKFWSAIHKKEWIEEYLSHKQCLGPLGEEPKHQESVKLREYELEIKSLKAKLQELTAAPTKPSRGLQEAMACGQASLQKPNPATTVQVKPAAETPKVTLSGRKVVVVGHGPVGHDFVVKVVGMVGDGALEISVLGEEPRLAYDRVHLTEYFEHRDANKLSIVDGSWFDEHKVTCKKNCQVVKVNRNEQIVDVKDTQTGAITHVPYDVLVLATGSYPFVPPLPNLSMDVRGAFVYRTIEDLEGMISCARKSTKAAVIGGGLLGLEAAKAVFDLGQEVHVLEMAPYLMPTQLDEPGGKALLSKIAEMGIKVHTSARLKSLVVENGTVKGVLMTDAENETEYILEIDMLVVSAGVRPRDELARECGLDIGARGGIVVDKRMRTNDNKIFAIGEVACYEGLCYGLIAPGWDQASVLAKNFEDATWGLQKKKVEQEAPCYEGSDLSTKLKLLGVDVASFGSSLDFWFKRQFDDSKAKEQGLSSTVQVDPFGGMYRKLVFNQDKKLMGGLLVGSAEDYFSLLNLAKQADLGNKTPGDLFLGGTSQEDANDLAEDAVVCLCQKVTKKIIIDAIKNEGCVTIPEIKTCTSAGNGCGGCVLNTGFIPKILKNALEAMGKKAFTGISPHFPFTRPELFEIIRVKELKTFGEVVHECARQGKIPDLEAALMGDEVCKPVVASILASLWGEVPVKDGLQQIQDTNDYFMANIQRSGQYSVIPRVAGGEITPQELILLGTTALKYNLWTKITGAQRIGLFGANMWQLPDIWEDLTYGKTSFHNQEDGVSVNLKTTGMESGQAYGKALRAVKSCVGTSWCRFGQQDSVSMAVALEERYKGFRAPHKLKMGVSGCMRECAEAQGKDIGLVATVTGYNLYICGNHGTSPKHAQLFLNDLSDKDCFKYIDRILMYYTFTAAPLTRTSKWLENLAGGIDFLKEVVIDDKLGLCEELERRWEEQVDRFECEWKKVVDTPELRTKFRQFVNVDDKKYGDLEWTQVRKQKKIQIEDMPTIIGQAKIGKDKADDSWQWVDVGHVSLFPVNGGGAVKVGKSELSVFNSTTTGKWYATQNSCPHKQLQVLSRGMVGMAGQVPKVACPIHKNTYNLETGKGISNPGLNLAAFDAKVDSGRVLIHVPPVDVLDRHLARDDVSGNSSCGGACELPKELQW